MEPKPFSIFLQELQNGDVNDELSIALNDLVKAIDVTDKAGTLTLKIKISPNKKSSMVFVDPEVKLNLPTLGRPSSMFFIDPYNRDLFRHDPRQMNFSDLQPKKLSDKLPENIKKI